ncbi:MAG: hypothetical protein WC796_04825 [Candidatus Pacearchaeota archaeon]
MMDNTTTKVYRCEDCNDTGMVKDKDGTCHTCWKCLSSGKLDNHSKKLPESNIRL